MAKSKLDVKNQKILYELDMDARQSLSSIAKKVGLSKESVNYRVKNLVSSRVINKFVTIINTARLGYLSYRNYIRYLNVTPEKEKEIIDYLTKHPNVYWFASLSGRWDLEVLIFARNFYHYNQIMQEILNKFGKNIKDNVLSMAIYNIHFKRRYLINKKEDVATALYGGEPEQPTDLDSTDIKLLSLLAENARMPTIDLGKKLHMAGNAVKYRIKKLVSKGVIQTYRLWVDTNKLGYELYKALITVEGLDEKKEKQMISFCQTIPNTLYFIRCNGPWNIEIEMEVKKYEDFRRIFLAFRSQFADVIKDFETTSIYKEHKINYFPMKLDDIKVKKIKWKK